MPFLSSNGPSLRPDSAALVIPCVRVQDDLEDRTLDVALEDVARMLDDPAHPGSHRLGIITLLNAAILDRHPYAAQFGPAPCR